LLSDLIGERRLQEGDPEDMMFEQCGGRRRRSLASERIRSFEQAKPAVYAFRIRAISPSNVDASFTLQGPSGSGDTNLSSSSSEYVYIVIGICVLVFAVVAVLVQRRVVQRRVARGGHSIAKVVPNPQCSDD
jgi:hypothetical protein